MTDTPAGAATAAPTDGPSDAPAHDASGPLQLTATRSTKLPAYAALVTAALLATVWFHRVELALLVTPFVAALVADVTLAAPPRLRVAVRLADERLIEGEETVVTVVLASAATVDRVELAVPLRAGLTPLADRGQLVRLRAGERREVDIAIRADQWGAYRTGQVVVRVRSMFGFTTYERWYDAGHVLRVYPGPATLRSLAAPRDTRLTVGSRVARAAGEGFEFADIRAFVPGDRVRAVNWRVTARRGALHVNDRHPERSGDVVLMLDTFTGSVLPEAVRATVALARAYLRERDRVGLVTFGGTLSWLRLGSGQRQLYRIMDAVVESTVVFSYAWKNLSLIPRQSLPPNALVLVVSPLQDTRTVRALLDLAGRGYTVAVLKVEQAQHTEPAPGVAGRLAHRLWRLDDLRLRDSLAAQGIPTVGWSEGQPLAAAVEEVAAYQRYARRGAG